jgi:2-succinyl-5-enolpyruvyl-6-hydroxy-3-cyclohexene-1-carboxylate synthase
VSAGGLAAAWSRELVGGLLRSGVDRVFISPGSRSTPLALAALDLAPTECSVVVDERAAAFAALGHARWTGRPCAVIATSGSAPAHWFPAIIEADRACVPLLVISADRPIELQEAGASQTIDQVRMFGTYVRKTFELGCPDELALGRLSEVALRAACAAVTPRPGPVHLNARFRKPLEPTAQPPLALPARQVPVLFPGRAAPSQHALRFLAEALERAERPLVVIGGGPFSASPRVEHVRRLRDAARALGSGWAVPVVAEHTSGLLPDPEGRGAGLGAALVAGVFDGPLAPDLVLELGSHPVASAYAAVAERAATRVVVGPEGAHDPLGNARAFIAAEPAALLEDLSAMSPAGGARPRHVAYARAVERACRAAVGAVRAELDESPAAGLDEPRAVAAFARGLPSGAVVAVGNSLAVRELESFAAHDLPAGTIVLHQRGAAGIDGLVAGAYGARLAAEPSRAVALLCGDVSALHDVGSFALLRGVDAPLLIVVVNNGGGRIFEQLPIHGSLGATSAFEELYLTPPPPGFLQHTARAYGLAFESASTPSEVQGAVQRAAEQRRATVIEIVVDPARAKDVGEAVRLAARAAAREEASHAK